MEEESNTTATKQAEEATKTRLPLRYLIGALLVLSNTVQYYANTTLYISAVEMVASDVLSRGLTELRAKHLSADPLAVGANAAAPGTCPVLTEEPQKWSIINQVNASLISAFERAALAKESHELELEVQSRVEAGELVDWSISERGYIYLAHTLGARLFAVPLGWAAMRIGMRTVALTSCLTSALAAAAFPTIVGLTNTWLVVVFNVFAGGMAFGIHCVSYPLIGCWFLADEVSAMVAYFFLAGAIGPALCNFVSAQMLAHQVPWQCCFYLSAGMLAVCALLLYLLVEDSPEQSALVSAGELKLLEQSAAKVNAAKQEQMSLLLAGDRCACSSRAQFRTCPARRVRRDPIWSRLLTCPTVWCCLGVNFAFYWFSKTSTLWPSYLANVAHLDAATIGYITASEGIACVLYGYLFAYLTRRLSVERPFNMSLTAYRRLNQLLATLAQSTIIGLLVLGDCSVWAAYCASTLKAVELAFGIASGSQIIMDVSAEDSGLLVSYIHCLSVGDVVGLPVSSAILAGSGESGDLRAAWRKVWLASLLVKLLAGGAFGAFARAQPASYSRARPAGQCNSLALRELTSV